MLETVIQDFQQLQHQIGKLSLDNQEIVSNYLEIFSTSLQQLVSSYESLMRDINKSEANGAGTYDKLEGIISNQSEEIRSLEKQLEKENNEHRRTILDLKKREARWQTILRHSSDLITIIEPDGRVRYHSPVLERILGYQSNAMIGKVYGELFHPDDMLAWQSYFAKLVEQPGVVFPIEYRIRHANGSWIYMDAIANSLLYDANVNGIIITSRDITERKQVEEALRVSENRYRTLSHLTSDFAYSFRTDPDGTSVCEWITEAFTKITGFTVAELESNAWLQLDYIHPDDKDRVWEQLINCQTTCTKENEYRLITKTGEVCWVRDCRQIIWDEQEKRIVRTYGACQDITEQKQAEAQLKQTNQSLEALIDASPLAIVVIDAQALVRIWNPAAELLFGWQASEVLGKTIPCIPVNKTEAFYKLLKSVLQGEVLKGLEVRDLRKDGVLIDLCLWTAPIRDDRDLITGSVRIYSDISERKGLEEERKKLEALKETPMPFWSRYVRS
jgi:PAS domain S-box-containing protein